MLVCPKCSFPLVQVNKSFQCENKHNYDIARQGYVNLLLGNQKMSGDSSEMVHARTHFLNQGFYAPLRQALIQILLDYHVSCLVDLGCGEGYYTKEMAKHVQKCIGIDMSKEALKVASTQDKTTQYVLASIFHCPLASHCADAITNVFAPLPTDEVLRLLKDDGIFIRVIPAAKHLWELKQVLYDEVYENIIDRAPESLKLIDEIKVEDVIEIKDTATIQALFQMTPYYWKTSKTSSERLLSFTDLRTQIAFCIQIYQKNA